MKQDTSQRAASAKKQVEPKEHSTFREQYNCFTKYKKMFILYTFKMPI